MQIFTDNKGQSWKLELTLNMVRVIRAALEIDLLTIGQKAADGEAPLISRLSLDIELLVNVIWVMLADQAGELDITDEEFGKRLGGNAIGQAEEAFVKELIDFFLGFRRKDAAAAIRRMVEGKSLAIDKAVSQIDQVDIGAILGKTSTDSPG